MSTPRIARHSTAWYEALDAFVAQRRARPFAWGEQDCCTFAADWVQLATGRDPMAQGLRGLCTAAQARRALADLGGLQAAWDARHGRHQAGAFAQAGDLALVTLPDGGSAMGICLGSCIAAPGTAGLELLPMSQAQATWRV